MADYILGESSASKQSFIIFHNTIAEEPQGSKFK